MTKIAADISPLGQLALIWMDKNADSDGMITASMTEIAKGLGQNRSSVGAAIGALVDIGHLRQVERGKGRRPARYEVMRREKPQPKPQPERPKAEVKIITSNTGSVRDAMRASIATLSAFCEWSRSAPKGSVCIYHIGQVSIDRLTSPELDRIAAAVAIMAEGGYVYPAQHPVALAFGTKNTYTAMRTGSGHVPFALLHDKVDPSDWLALRAIDNRASAQSAGRALRDGLGLSEMAASSLLARMASRGLIERGRNLAWDVSAKGRDLLL